MDGNMNSDMSMQDPSSNRSSTPVSPFERSLSEEEGIKTKQQQTSASLDKMTRAASSSSAQNSFMILDILENPQNAKREPSQEDMFKIGQMKSLIKAFTVTNQKATINTSKDNRNNNDRREGFHIDLPNMINYSSSTFDLKRSFNTDPSRTNECGISTSKKLRKARTAFTDAQLAELETSFNNQKYLSVQDRMELAERLNLSDMQVKTWYQNRRTKWKRQTAVGLELLNEVGNLDAVQRILQTNAYWAYHPATQNLITELEQNRNQSALSPPAKPSDVDIQTGVPDDEGNRPAFNVKTLPKPLQELLVNRKELINDAKGSNMVVDMLNNFMKFSNLSMHSSSHDNGNENKERLKKVPSPPVNSTSAFQQNNCAPPPEKIAFWQ